MSLVQNMIVIHRIFMSILEKKKLNRRLESVSCTKDLYLFSDNNLSLETS